MRAGAAATLLIWAATAAGTVAWAGPSARGWAQQAGTGSDDRAAVIGIVEAALAAITAENTVALTDLMIDDAVLYSIREQDGQLVQRAQTRAEQRAADLGVDIVERGFEPHVLVTEVIAMAWVPYDLYVDGAWSHCGVDIFTLVRTDAGWRISSMSWSVEQPPACRPHPSGPPPGATGPDGR